ncbi:MAG: PD-(D/E)XK nuclease family protein, partial [Bacilli bacterium]|nr:PD-(D/E)XK nuclease family protein [Bacilli bacterium]
IAHPSRKEFYLRKKVDNPYLDLEVMTLPEMKALFDYNYDDRALRFLLGKGYRYLEAKELLAAFVAPNFEKGKEVKKYAELREELIREHLLFKTAYPERTFIGSHVLISGYYNEGETVFNCLKKVDGMLQIDYEIEGQNNPSTNAINIFIDPYEEFHFVYNKICYDIDVNKTPIENICVYGLTSDYVPLIKEFNKVYGITIDLETDERLFDMGIYKCFRDTYLDTGLEDAIRSMREKYPDSKDADTIESFAREFAVVFENSPAKTLQIYDDIAKEKKRAKQKHKNVIKVLNEPVCPPDVHLYCLNFSMGQYPIVASESGLFSDEEKKLIGLETSEERSLNDSERVDRLLRSTSLKLLTFFENGFESARFLSGFKDKYNMTVVSNPIAEDENGPYEYAHDKGGFLYAALEDEYENYLQDDKRREAYKSISDLKEYREYNYEFKGMNSSINKSRYYSASSLKNYRSCPFKYLMTKVVGDESETDFKARIGTVFHKTLELYHTDPDFDFDKAYSLAIEMEQGLKEDPADTFHEEKTLFTTKEKVLIENLRSYCKESLEFQKEFEGNLKDAKFIAEGGFDVDINGITITGRYDKVITFDYAGKRHAFIVDYKSGTEKFDEGLFRSEHGLSLQLPLYALALENKKADFDDASIAGLFIAPVIPYSLTNDKKKSTLEELDKSKLRLNGLFLADTSFLKSIEPGLTRYSSLFASCELKGTDFAASKSEYPKSKSYAEFHDLAERMKKIIEESDEAISNGKFDIKPTMVKNKHDACEYCHFHDVCYINKNKIIYENLSKNNMKADVDDDDFDDEEGDDSDED